MLPCNRNPSFGLIDATMKKILMRLLRRLWILPVVYIFIYKMELPQKYPDAFLITVIIVTTLMCIYDFVKKGNKEN